MIVAVVVSCPFCHSFGLLRVWLVCPRQNHEGARNCQGHRVSPKPPHLALPLDCFRAVLCAVSEWCCVLFQSGAVCCFRAVLCAVSERCCVLFQSGAVCCFRVVLCAVSEWCCVLFQSGAVCCFRAVLCAVSERCCVLFQSGRHKWKVNYPLSFLSSRPPIPPPPPAPSPSSPLQAPLVWTKKQQHFCFPTFSSSSSASSFFFFFKPAGRFSPPSCNICLRKVMES